MQLENTQMTIEEKLNVIELWQENRPNVMQIHKSEISPNVKDIIDKWLAFIGQSNAKLSKADQNV